jgi:hypothetical protein
MKFENTTEEDIWQVSAWQDVNIDPAHHGMDPNFWLTGRGYIAFKLVDDEGIAMYVRFNRVDDKTLRLFTQFAPESDVSKQRTAGAILQAIPVFIKEVVEDGIEAIVFESRSESLINFMSTSFGFEHLKDADYILRFQKHGAACATVQE